MMQRTTQPLLFLLVAVVLLIMGDVAGASRSLLHITFVSGNQINADQSFWTSVIHTTVQREMRSATATTDALLWLGNPIERPSANTKPSANDNEVSDADLQHSEEVAKQYMRLRHNPHYAAFVGTNTNGDENDGVAASGPAQILGVWDANEVEVGGDLARDHPQRTAAIKDAYLSTMLRLPTSVMEDLRTRQANFFWSGLPAPAESALAHHFVYGICVVALDLFTARGPWTHLGELLHLFDEHKMNEAGYPMHRTVERNTTDLLGEEQWAWLEELMRTRLSSRAPTSSSSRKHCAMTIIASPWQLLLNDNKANVGWDLLPAARTRLLAMMKQWEVERVVILSGHAEAGEVGEVMRAAERDVHPHGILGLYTRRMPISSITKAAAELLPVEGALLEVTSSGLTKAVSEVAVVGKWYEMATRATVREDGEANSIIPRYLHVRRRTTAVRNFGTLQLRANGAERADASVEEVLASTELSVAVHGINDGVDLLRFVAMLNELPSYHRDDDDDVAAATEQVDHVLPQFTVFNTPGEFPPLKQWALEHECAELPCEGSTMVLYAKVGITVAALVGVPLLTILLAFRNGWIRWPTRGDQSAPPPTRSTKVKTD